MTTIDLSCITYDASAAQAEVERVNKEQPIENRKNRIWNLCFIMLLFVIGMAGVSALAYYLFSIKKIFGDFSTIPAFCMVGIAFMLFCVIYGDIYRPVLSPYEWYSLNAKYYLTTKDYKVLECTVNYQHDNEYTIHLTMENKNHVVVHDCITYPQVRRVVRTDVDTTSLNLLDEKLYVPYQK